MTQETTFDEWARSHGVQLHGIVACDVEEGGRGLVAIRDITEGTVLIRVPEDLLISRRSAERDAAFWSALTEHPRIPAEQVLALHLLHELSKGKTSFWYPYLKQLPRSHATIAHFSEEEAVALQVPYATRTARSARQKASDEWHEALGVLKVLNVPKRLRTLGAWMWARATCDSRTVSVPFDSAGALCPMGDLFNYAPPAVPAEPEVDSKPLLPPMPRKAPERGTGPPPPSQETPADRPVPGSDPPQPPVNLEAAQPVSSRSGESAVHAEGMALLPSDDEMVPERTCSSGAGGEGSYVESAREYHFRAKTPARKGEQVLMCYGMYSNLELLVCMPEGLLRRLGLWEEGADGDAASRYLQASGAPSWDLMCALRLAEVPVHVRSQCRFQAHSGERLSIQARAKPWPSQALEGFWPSKARRAPSPPPSLCC
ncbi:hypothetical protein CYMTET_39960 [Cymbomonas tetramitiformis]|uniref:SET domain-containing protein n=1 Tax=Cymbomonas tetramitiformis TaxID=36881 RepID=A0AAE0F3G6_9CHLO|nr:hypothetical protein CYMTET_39960 [Cymbomonas tetramitiformis]